MFYIPQIEKDDCGFACLKMLLATLNKDKKYLFLPQDEKHGMYSFQELIDTAGLHGLTLFAFRATDQLSSSNKPKLPFIAILHLKNGAKHAVLVTKIRLGRVIYLDPRCGKTNVSINRFLFQWDGTGLMVQEHRKRECPLPTLEPISTSSKIWLGIIQVFSGLFAVFGVYFIRDDVTIYWPIIFLSLAIVGETIMKIISYNLMKKMDKFFFEEKRIPSSGFKDYLFRFEDYKRLVLSSPMNYILSLIFSLGIIALVLLNDWRNFAIAGMPVLLAFLVTIIIDPILRKKKYLIGELEENLDNSTGALDFKEKVQRMHREAYRFSYIDIIYRTIVAILMIMTVVLTMDFCRIFSLPFVIFYSFFSLTLFKSCEHLFSFNEKIERFNKAKVKISNLIKTRD